MGKQRGISYGTSKMNFVFKYEDSQNFEKLWNQYLTSYNVDFQYSLTSIEYYLAYCNNLYKIKALF